MVLLGFTCFDLISLGFSWPLLVSLGSHLVSLGLTGVSLVSLGLIWFHLVMRTNSVGPLRTGPAGPLGTGDQHYDLENQQNQFQTSEKLTRANQESPETIYEASDML